MNVYRTIYLHKNLHNANNDNNDDEVIKYSVTRACFTKVIDTIEKN